VDASRLHGTGGAGGTGFGSEPLNRRLPRHNVTRLSRP
jgi:hypothetical protein